MAIVYRERDDGRKTVVMLVCPFCGHEFDRGHEGGGGGESRPRHFVNEHGPEDAGLSPLRERVTVGPGGEARAD